MGRAPRRGRRAERRAVARRAEERRNGGAAVVVYSRQGVGEVESDDELDVALVERLQPTGIAYTPRAEDAIARVDRGDAGVAFLVRPPRIDDVFRLARAGRVMPEKTTYFYPKLTSGLLLQPLD